MSPKSVKTLLEVSQAKKAAGTLLALAIFFLLGRVLYVKIGALLAYEWHLRYHLLLASLLPLSLNYLIAAYVWTVILKMLGQSMSFSQSFRITYLSSSGKYIPGRIWTYVGRIYLATKAGLPKIVTLVSMVLMFAAYNSIALLFFLFTLLLWENVPRALVTTLILFLCVLVLLVLHPKVLGRGLNFFLRLFKKEKFRLKASYKKILFLLGLLILDRVIFSTFAYLFINSFMTLDWLAVVRYSGVFSVAVLLGMIAFIVPAGLGVREGVQTYLLSFFLPLSTAVFVALAIRGLMTLVELMCFAAALKINKLQTYPSPAKGPESETSPLGQVTRAENEKASRQPVGTIES